MEKFLKLTLFIMFAPILFMIGLNHIEWMWVQLPLLPRIVLIALSPALVALLLHLFAPKAAWAKQIKSSIGELYALPFRAIGAAVRYVYRAIRH